MPSDLAESMGFQAGLDVFLILEDDVLILRKTNKVSLHSPVTRAAIWGNKIKKEYRERSERGVSAILGDEDVYMLLLLGEWNPELIACLLKKPDLLEILWDKLTDDEELYSFFCKRVQHFLLECANEATPRDVANSPQVKRSFRYAAFDKLLSAESC